MYLDRVLAQFAGWGGDPASFRACTPAEVELLERDRGITLPAAYREFLGTMGHDTGELFACDDCRYDELARIDARARGLLKQNRVEVPLPEEAFVFYATGYEFFFFRTDEGDDPPVYHYLEGEPVKDAYLRLCARYTDFLMLGVEEWF